MWWTNPIKKQIWYHLTLITGLSKINEINLTVFWYNTLLINLGNNFFARKYTTLVMTFVTKLDLELKPQQWQPRNRRLEINPARIATNENAVWKESTDWLTWKITFLSNISLLYKILIYVYVNMIDCERWSILLLIWL